MEASGDYQDYFTGAETFNGDQEVNTDTRNSLCPDLLGVFCRRWPGSESQKPHPWSP